MPIAKAIFIISILCFNNGHDQLINLKKVIGNYPPIGSLQEKIDFTTLHYFQKHRSEQDCALAKKEEKVSLKTLFGGDHGLLSQEEIYRLTPLFMAIQLHTVVYSQLAKAIYHRPRPYLRDRDLNPCIKKVRGFSYPSGHSTIARYTARVLAFYFPDLAL